MDKPRASKLILPSLITPDINTTCALPLARRLTTRRSTPKWNYFLPHEIASVLQALHLSSHESKDRRYAKTRHGVVGYQAQQAVTVI